MYTATCRQWTPEVLHYVQVQWYRYNGMGTKQVQLDKIVYTCSNWWHVVANSSLIRLNKENP